MSTFTFPFPRSAARLSVGLAALLAFHPAFAVDEYVVYGKRAPVIAEVDRAVLLGELEQHPGRGAGVFSDSVRAALAEALRAERMPSDLRFASNEQRPRA